MHYEFATTGKLLQMPFGTALPCPPASDSDIRRCLLSTPTEERVVKHHAVCQHLMIVRKVLRETAGDRDEAIAFGSEIVASRICTPDDGGEAVQCRDVDLVDLDDFVE